MTRRVVVTGSSGHIGRAVVGHLAAAGVDVVGVDRRPSPTTAVVADLATTALAPVLAGGAAVVHCAALHAPHLGRFSADEFTLANVVVTERLLADAVRAGVTRFVLASSTSVYGRALEADDRTVWVDESLCPEPRDIYDATKLEAEAMVAGHAGPTLETVTLRIGRCFVEPWRTTVVNRLYRGVDRRDVIAAIERALVAAVDGHLTVNVAGPRVFEQVDVVDLRADPVSVLDRRAPWIASEFGRRGWELPTTIDRVYVSDLAIARLGYRPRYGVRDALDRDPTC